MSEIDSLSSTSENDSISSSSSNSTSSSGVLDLGASAWNRHKEKRPLKGRTLMQELSGGGAENEHENHNHKQPQQQHVPIHLLQKQIYSSASVTRERIPDSISDRPCKTELEEAVLQDCLTHHFLFSEMHPIHQLIHAFEKVKFRNNEIIFRQGTPAEYLYILYQGDVKTIADTNDESIVPVFGSKYTLLGELELLTHIPYQSTVKATSNPCIFFRLAVADFDRLRQQQRQQQESPSDSQEQKLRLLRQAMPTELVTYFQDDDPAILNRLVSNMKRQPFQKGQVLLPKKKRLDALVLIAEGTVVATHNTAGGRAYEDLVIGPGHSRISFGWQSVMDVSDSEDDDSAMRGRIVARTDGYALLISKRAFENAFHSHHSNNVSVHELAKMRWKRQQLEQITLFKDSRLSTLQLRELMDLMHHCEYGQDQVIFKVGQKVEAAMYFVREGSVRLESNKGRDVDVVEAGGYFGEKNMLLDQNKAEQKHHEKRSLIKAIAASHSTKIDVLYLEECRRVINTTKLGLGASSTVCSIDPDFEPSCLRRHVMLGRGSYGQVWLASVPGSDGKAKNVVALKVQPKYQLLQTSNPQRIIAERNILASLHSPFISRLYFACQDERRLYMVTELLQGGELKTLLPQEGLSESAAKFYAAGILEGLTHMHRKHIIHRDVKTENVLLNEKGYPVLIDFGFAKYVPDKTFTFCGSPMLMAPEIIRHKGHDKGADHWSWAVTIYKMVTGRYPFFEKGINELDLYKKICKGSFELNGLMSVEFRLLMVAVLYPDPSQRLGSRANGWRDIFAAPWFANDPSLDLSKLRKQALQAPWVPEVKDALDDSRFHSDPSIEDLIEDVHCLKITKAQQETFKSFGPVVDSVGMRVYS